jgi:hypothetical protein
MIDDTPTGTQGQHRAEIQFKAYAASKHFHTHRHGDWRKTEEEARRDGGSLLHQFNEWKEQSSKDTKRGKLKPHRLVIVSRKTQVEFIHIER